MADRKTSTEIELEMQLAAIDRATCEASVGISKQALDVILATARERKKPLLLTLTALRKARGA